jgi:hypothetical protein
MQRPQLKGFLASQRSVYTHSINTEGEQVIVKLSQTRSHIFVSIRGKAFGDMAEKSNLMVDSIPLTRPNQATRRSALHIDGGLASNHFYTSGMARRNHVRELVAIPTFRNQGVLVAAKSIRTPPPAASTTQHLPTYLYIPHHVC